MPFFQVFDEKLNIPEGELILTGRIQDIHYNSEDETSSDESVEDTTSSESESESESEQSDSLSDLFEDSSS